MLNSVIFIFSLFLIVGLLPPVQLYGSTILCDPSLNLTNCDEESPSSSTSDPGIIDNSRSDTPLIIPDISPTDKDLDDAMTDGDLGTTDTDVNNDNDNDNDDSENSIDENSDTDKDDDKDSSNSEGGSSDNEPSLIPFP